MDHLPWPGLVAIAWVYGRPTGARRRQPRPPRLTRRRPTRRRRDRRAGSSKCGRGRSRRPAGKARGRWRVVSGWRVTAQALLYECVQGEEGPGVCWVVGAAAPPGGRRSSAGRGVPSKRRKPLPWAVGGGGGEGGWE